MKDLIAPLAETLRRLDDGETIVEIALSKPALLPRPTPLYPTRADRLGAIIETIRDTAIDAGESPVRAILIGREAAERLDRMGLVCP